MSSYSLRRVSPTVAALAELTEPEKVALGGWLEKGQNVAVSAARYNAEKMRQCEQLRLALRYTLDVVTAGYQPTFWREDAFQQGMELADHLLAAAGAMQFVPYTVPGMPVLKQLTLEESQIARLRRTPVKARPPLPVAPSGPVPLAPALSKAAPVAPGGAGVPPIKRRLPLAKAAVAKAKTASASPRASSAAGPSSPSSSAVVVLDVAREATDEGFNLAARELRQSRPGHSGNPEAPTLVYSRDECKIWLGGLPNDRDLRLLVARDVLQASGR
eukprot:s3349_g11.t1